MTSLAGPWSAGAPQQFNLQDPNRFGQSSFTVGGVQGPQFDSTGNALRTLTPEQGWAEFFGKPRKDIPKRTDDELQVELYDLPAAYEGKNSYMSQIIISRIANDEMWLLREFAPWMKCENAMEFTWDQWTFSDHMLGRTPEESVSRLLTSTSSVGQASLVRFGIALMFEHGFFNTPKGQKNYQMNILQIQNAIVQTAAFGAMNAALTAEPPKDPFDSRRIEQNRTRTALDDFFEMEKRSWGMLQKSEDGFVNMVAEMKDSIMQRSGNVKPDLLCLPMGAKKYMQNALLGQPYSMTGYKAGQAPPPVGSSYEGLKIHESQWFRQGENKPAIDPVFQDRTIGTFAQCSGHFVKGVDPADFKIHMLDTVLYNEDRDEEELFPYRDNFKYLGLFERFGEVEFAQQSYIGRQYFAPWRNWYQYIEATSPNFKNYIIKGILSKGAECQAKFAHAMLGGTGESAARSRTNNNNNNLSSRGGGGGIIPTLSLTNNPFSTTSSTTNNNNGTTQSNGRARGGHNVVPTTASTAEHKQQGPDDLLNTAQARFVIPSNETTPLAQLLQRLDDIDRSERLEPERSLLRKAQHLIQKYPEATPHLFVQLNADLADELLKVDLNRAANDVCSGAARVSKTDLEEAFAALRDPVWPEKPQESFKRAETKSPLWKLGASGRAPVNVYEGINRFKAVTYHSQVFTLTSTHSALLRLPLHYIDQLKKPDGFQVEGELEDVRRGDLMFSVALSSVFELFKLYMQKFGQARDPASKLALYDQVCSDIGLLSHGWSMYPEQMEAGMFLPPLHCQHELSAIIALIKRVIEAQLHNNLDAKVCSEALMAFMNLWNSFYSEHNSAYGKQSVMQARLNTSHNNQAHRILSKYQQGETSFHDEAVQHVRKLHASLCKELKEPDQQVLDSFVPFQDSYVQLYQVIKAAGKSTDDWKAVVADIQKKYKAHGGSVQALNIARETLDYAFTAVADGDPLDANFFNKINTLVGSDNQQNELFKKLASTHAERLNYYYANAAGVDQSSEDGFETEGRARRKRAIDGDKTGLNITDKAVVDALEITKSTTNLQDLVTAVQGVIPRNSPVDIGAHVLLEVVCLRAYLSSTPALLDALASSPQSILKDWAIQIKNYTRGGSLVQIQKEVLAKWGQVKPVESDAERKAAEQKRKDYKEDYVSFTEGQVIDLLKAGSINGAFIQFCIDCDVLPPLGNRIVRQGMTYSAGTAWMAEGGGKCASTLFGHADFQLADDAARKVHYGHFTMYNRTVVWSVNHIIHAPNVFIKAYKGGNGTLVYDPLNIQDVENYTRRGIFDRDIHMLPTHISTFTTSQHMSITGAYHKKLAVTSAVAQETKLHGIEIYAKLWGWSRGNSRDPMDRSHWVTHSPNANTICFQAHQRSWHAAKKDYCTHLMEKGHWGSNVYAGCGQTRKGGIGSKTLINQAAIPSILVK